jgi:hypothetical protein
MKIPTEIELLAKSFVIAVGIDFLSKFFVSRDYAEMFALFGFISSALAQSILPWMKYQRNNARFLEQERRGLSKDTLNIEALDASGIPQNFRIPSLNQDVSARTSSFVKSLGSLPMAGTAETLSPFELAYVGYVDLLELTLQSEKVKASFMNSVATTMLRTLESAANALRADPTSYEKQLVFKQAIVSFIDGFDEGLAAFKVSVRELKETLATTKAQFTKVQNDFADYKDVQNLSPRMQILHAKLNTDLKAILEAEMNDEGLLSVVEVIRGVTQSLTEERDLARNEGAPWRDMAGTVLMELTPFLGNSK